MEQNIEEFKPAKSSRIWSGLVLVVIGFLLLAYKMGAPIPGWIFTWPVLLIAIGLFVGIKSQFKNPGSFIMIIIGTIFLLDNSIPGIDFHNYIVPIILISLGLIFILRPRRSYRHRGRRNWDRLNPDNPNAQNLPNNFNGENVYSDNTNGEYINVHSVFGGIKKNVTTKNFKGGEIVSFMGGSEINFMQADIQQPVIVEVNNVFGGTKLIIPSNWDLKNEISAVFGGVEDKRSFNTSVPDSTKKIVLKGACVFGGIEVTNY
jgi:predicted membrane protein